MFGSYHFTLPHRTSLSLLVIFICTTQAATSFKCLQQTESLYCLPPIDESVEKNDISFRIPEYVTYDSVENIEFSHEKNVPFVPIKLFEVFHNLKKLTLNKLNITQLLAGDFTNAHELTEIDLTENHLEKIPARAFTGASKLKLINLNENKIHTIEDLAFEGLSALESLNLFGNHLTRIGRLTFANLPELLVLDISVNEIEEIDGDAFNFPKLSNVDMNSNKLRSLPGNLFARTTRLQAFSANNNSLHHLNDALQHLQRLNVLNLGDNHIADFDLVKLSQTPNLTYVHLENNGIDFDLVDVTPADVAASKSPIRKLDLSGNKIASGVILQKLQLFTSLNKLFIINCSMPSLDLHISGTGRLNDLAEIYIAENPFSKGWTEKTCGGCGYRLRDNYDGLHILL